MRDRPAALRVYGKAWPVRNGERFDKTAFLLDWQGWRARYRGSRKNLFDLRRSAVIHNLHELARLPAFQLAA